METNQWLSLHIYYHDSERFDHMIANSISPTIDYLCRQFSISHFFFIRYWEGGPHIRLRILLNPSDKNVIQDIVINRIQKYFDENPSKINLNNLDYYKKIEQSGITINSENIWYDNHSLQEITYEQEYLRYGGVEAMKIAHLSFQFSSEAVFQILGIHNTDQKKLGIAMDMMLLTALALEKPLDIMYRFFESYSRYFKVYNPNEQFESEFLNQCQQSFRQQSSILKTRIANLVNSYLYNRCSTLNKFYTHWIESYEDVFRKLDAEHLKGRLQDPIKGQFLDGKQMESYGYVKQVIAKSYIHMNNNRLGLTPYQESYLAFLLAQGIKIITDEGKIEYVENS